MRQTRLHSFHATAHNDVTMPVVAVEDYEVQQQRQQTEEDAGTHAREGGLLGGETEGAGSRRPSQRSRSLSIVSRQSRSGSRLLMHDPSDVTLGGGRASTAHASRRRATRDEHDPPHPPEAKPIFVRLETVRAGYVLVRFTLCFYNLATVA